MLGKVSPLSLMNWIREPLSSNDVLMNNQVSKHVVSIGIVNQLWFFNTIIYTGSSILKNGAVQLLKTEPRSWFQPNWERKFWIWGMKFVSKIWLTPTFSYRKMSRFQFLLKIGCDCHFKTICSQILSKGCRLRFWKIKAFKNVPFRIVVLPSISSQNLAAILPFQWELSIRHFSLL